MTMPWDDARLDDVEAQARACTSEDACTVDVLALVAEVRRLREQMRLGNTDPDVTLVVRPLADVQRQGDEA